MGVFGFCRGQLENICHNLLAAFLGKVHRCYEIHNAHWRVCVSRSNVVQHEVADYPADSVSSEATGALIGEASGDNAWTPEIIKVKSNLRVSPLEPKRHSLYQIENQEEPTQLQVGNWVPKAQLLFILVVPISALSLPHSKSQVLLHHTCWNFMPSTFILSIPIVPSGPTGAKGG